MKPSLEEYLAAECIHPVNSFVAVYNEPFMAKNGYREPKSVKFGHLVPRAIDWFLPVESLAGDAQEVYESLIESGFTAEMAEKRIRALQKKAEKNRPSNYVYSLTPQEKEMQKVAAAIIAGHPEALIFATESIEQDNNPFFVFLTPDWNLNSLMAGSSNRYAKIGGIYIGGSKAIGGAYDIRNGEFDLSAILGHEMVHRLDDELNHVSRFITQPMLIDARRYYSDMRTVYLHWCQDTLSEREKKVVHHWQENARKLVPSHQSIFENVSLEEGHYGRSLMRHMLYRVERMVYPGSSAYPGAKDRLFEVLPRFAEGMRDFCGPSRYAQIAAGYELMALLSPDIAACAKEVYLKPLQERYKAAHAKQFFREDALSAVHAYNLERDSLSKGA